MCNPISAAKPATVPATQTAPPKSTTAPGVPVVAALEKGAPVQQNSSAQLIEQLKTLLATISALVAQLSTPAPTQKPVDKPTDLPPPNNVPITMPTSPINDPTEEQLKAGGFISAILVKEKIKTPGLADLFQQATDIQNSVIQPFDATGVPEELGRTLLGMHDGQVNQADFLRTRVIPTVEGNYLKTGTVNESAMLKLRTDLPVLAAADADLRALAAKGAALTQADIEAAFPSITTALPG